MPSESTVNTSLLEQELAPLNAQIELVRDTLAELDCEMRAAEAELETYAADRLRFDALRDACNVLERLDALEAGQLFWGEVPEFQDPAGHLARLRSRISSFDEEIRGVLDKQGHIKAQINQRQDELDYLYDDVQNAHTRNKRREEEFLIERELSEVPEHPLIMPWSHDGEVERRYRRAMSIAMLLCLLVTVVVRLVHLPAPVRPVVVPIPERLAMMVRKEHKKPEPVKKAKAEKKDIQKEPAKAEKPGEKVAEKKQEKKQAVAQETPAPERPKAAAVEQTAAPKRSQTAGVLAFKESFKDLIDETPVAKLGAEARLSNPATHAAGQAQASRSLVTSQAGRGASGGAGYAAVSRNVGNGGSGGIGTASVSRSVGGGAKDGRLGRGEASFTQVKSGIAGIAGGKEGRPLSSGARASRTDEEIQILFDRYKAALYRIYNTELRKDPTLRGKMVLRISIEPSGAVSACAVDSSNMNAAEFSAQIVDRVRKFNFGPKEGVPKTTILYPIDFLPAR
jgi:outer membrane biosynthesis protein TonB